MDGNAEIDTTGAEALEKAPDAPDTGGEANDRDYEAEAKALGWQPVEDFKGDPARHVDAKTFVERGETMLPLIKAQLAKTNREFAEFRKEARRAVKFMGDAEQRGYERALAELQTKHDAAVEKGDVAAARKVVKEMGDLAKPDAPDLGDDSGDDTQRAKREFAEWVEANDWYVTDDKKRAYADIQADAMGPVDKWPGGGPAWLEELGKRVTRKFADKPPNPVNGGGNRGGGSRGGKTFADLPADAKAVCDKWVKSGLIKDRQAYVDSYQFD